jgi:hypothetical protein
MGNVSGNINTLGNQVGSAQTSIGQASSEMQVISSYFIGAILVIIGIVCIIFALVPTNKLNCNSDQEKMNSDFICNKHDSDTAAAADDAVKCDKAKSDLDLKNKECNVKTRKYIFLLGGLCIPFAIFIIWYSRWWNKKTHENPGYAQLGAMTMEAGLLSQVFHGRR